MPEDRRKSPKLARQIYLEHREAIELIYRYRPEYQAEIKQVLREAISRQESWKLDVEGNPFVRFRPVDWDRFESQRSGSGWGGSPTLLLFELYCPSDPTQASGPYLVLGPSSDENIRQELFETARQKTRRCSSWDRLRFLVHTLVFMTAGNTCSASPI